MPSGTGFVTAEVARARITADLEVIDAALARLRGTCTDLVGNAFRVQLAERLETQHRVNRGLSYRMIGEIADPPDGVQVAVVPAAVGVRELVWTALRITPGEIARRARIAARIGPRRALSGPALAAELPVLGAAVAAGALGEDHITAICRALDVLPAAVGAADREKAEDILVSHARRHDAGFVTAVGRMLADRLNPDGTFDETDRARRRGLYLSAQGPDGMSRLTGWLDPEARSYLDTVTAAMRPGHRTPEQQPAADTRSAAQRCHDGLKAGLKAGIASGALGTHLVVRLRRSPAKPRQAVVVVVDNPADYWDSSPACSRKPDKL